VVLSQAILKYKLTKRIDRSVQLIELKDRIVDYKPLIQASHARTAVQKEAPSSKWLLDVANKKG